MLYEKYQPVNWRSGVAHVWKPNLPPKNYEFFLVFNSIANIPEESTAPINLNQEMLIHGTFLALDALLTIVIKKDKIIRNWKV